MTINVPIKKEPRQKFKVEKTRIEMIKKSVSLPKNNIFEIVTFGQEYAIGIVGLQYKILHDGGGEALDYQYQRV